MGSHPDVRDPLPADAGDQAGVEIERRDDDRLGLRQLGQRRDLCGQRLLGRVTSTATTAPDPDYKVPHHAEEAHPPAQADPATPPPADRRPDPVRPRPAVLAARSLPSTRDAQTGPPRGGSSPRDREAGARPTPCEEQCHVRPQPVVRRPGSGPPGGVPCSPWRAILTWLVFRARCGRLGDRRAHGRDDRRGLPPR